MSGAWKALPAGSEIPLRVGSTYALVASVSASTTKAQIDQALSKYFPGVTVISYLEQGQAGGPLPDPDASRKQVAAIVRDDSFTGTLSWSKGFPIVAPNIYTLSGAWILDGAPAPDEAPWAGALPVRRPGSPWPWLVGALAVGTIGWGLYHARKPILKGLAHAA